MSYTEVIRLISNGQPVDSSINTIFRQLAGNIDYVKSILDAASMSQAIKALDVTLDSAVKVGQPVYYDAATSSFKQALAAATVDTESGELITADSTQVWGICSAKTNSTKGDILLQGYAEVDMTEAITGSDAGLYFLSGVTAGKLVKQKPPVSVTVLYWDGESKVFVNTSFDDAFLKHQHYKFALQAVPSGSNVIAPEGSRHTIFGPDATIEGWLPADQLSNAPAGAKFGYNIATSALENIWPPLPLDGTTITWTRPVANNLGNVSMPGNLLHVQSFSKTANVAAGSSTSLTLNLTPTPSITSAVVAINQKLFTDAGYTVSDVTLSATDTVTFKVTNNTDATINLTGTVTAFVYDVVTVAVNESVDFKEDTVPDELLTLDANGIWWMTDAYGLVPWPTNYGQTPTTPTTYKSLVSCAAYGVARRTVAGGSDAAIFYGEFAKTAADVVVDADNHTAYVAVDSLGKIVKVNTNQPQLGYETIWAGTGSAKAGGLDLDINTGYIYFTDEFNGKIFKVKTDGTGLTQLVTGLTSPRGIRVDTSNSYLYFIADTKIKRCTLTGASVTDIVTGLTTPEFLAVDPANSYLYWTDSSTAKLQRATTAGASITDLVTSATGITGIDLAVADSYIYYTQANLIKRCSLTGTGVTTIETLVSSDVLANLRFTSLTAFGTDINDDLSMQLTLWFTKMQFQSASTVVTSLKAATDSGLTITCLNDGTTDKTTGDLEIDFDPDLLVDSGTTTTGYLVFKQFTDKKFYKGPVVEGLIVDSDYIVASSTHQVGDLHQGTISLSYTPTPVGSELPIEMVRLNNVTEENYQDVLGLGFPADVDSEYRAKVNIPSTIEATSVNIKLRFVMLVRAAGDLPAFTLTARALARPGKTAATSVSLPTSDSSVVLSVASATGLSQDYYVEIESDAIVTTPGGSLLFTLSRTGTSDSFSGDIHVIDQRAAISAVA